MGRNVVCETLCSAHALWLYDCTLIVAKDVTLHKIDMINVCNMWNSGISRCYHSNSGGQ